MQLLKQSTAATVKVGPFLDSTDGVTAETGLTISQADVRLSKNGGNIAQKNEASACTHDELGYYDCSLDSTDTGTLGRLLLAVSESGALPVWHEFMVLPANVYDSLVAGLDALQVHANEITAGLITAAAVATGTIDADAIADGAIDAGAIAADAIGASELASDAVAEIADAVWDEAKSGHVGAGSFGEEVQAHALSSEISALDDPTAAEIRAEIDSNSTQLAAIVADTNELQTDDVPGLIAALNDPTAAAIADAVWDENIVAAHNTADTAGALLDDVGTPDDFKADVSSLATAAALATVDSNVDAILADTGTDGVVIADGAITAASIANDAITAGKIATDAITSSELATNAAQEIADEVLKRGISNVEDAADTLSLAALVLAHLESSISGSTWIIRKSGGSTFTTKTVTTDSGADPVTGVT
jgi:hypothetical protein